MPNIKLTLEYDGTRYHGWQRQRSHPTLQGILEEKIKQLTGEPVKVFGAGRTDAGVHAIGQVANFKARARLDERAWQRALNSLLPEDIIVRKVEKVGEAFHARYDARSKIYRYCILNRPYRMAIGRQYCWVVYLPLDLARMRQAARTLFGRHDFSAFQAGSLLEKTRSAICTVKKLSVTRNRDEILLTIEADRFLHQMVRTIVGTVVEVGRGKRRPEEVREILRSRDRSRAGQTAPPQGLFLLEVKY
jgi:tRNA pseudouridine38-40 synthase